MSSNYMIKSKSLCVPSEQELLFKGNMELAEASTPILIISRCTPKSGTTCKSNQEIDNFVDGKRLQVFLRTQLYDPNDYSESVIRPEIKPYYFSLKHDETQAYQIGIVEQNLQTDHQFYSLGFLSEERIFHVLQDNPDRAAVLDSDHFAEISFSMDFYKVEHQRTIYGPLDFLGDVGGLADALTAIGGVIVYLTQVLRGDQLTKHLITSLFMREKKQPQNKAKDHIKDLESRRPFEFKEALCYFMRSKKEKKQIERGRSRILKQLDLAHYVRLQLYMQIALKALFSKSELYLLKNNRRFVLNQSLQEHSSQDSDFRPSRSDLGQLTERMKALLQETTEAGKQVKKEVPTTARSMMGNESITSQNFSQSNDQSYIRLKQKYKSQVGRGHSLDGQIQPVIQRKGTKRQKNIESQQ